MKSILSFVFDVLELSQLQNDTSFIISGHGIQILQSKKDWKFLFRDVSFPAFAGIPAFMKSKFPHFYLFLAHFGGF